MQIKLLKLTRDRVAFKCKCGERVVNVTNPPFVIWHDTQNRITLRPPGKVDELASVGMENAEQMKAESRYCHFFVEHGEIVMCDDANCPGAMADAG